MSVAKSQIFISGNLEGLNCTEKSVSDLIKALLQVKPDLKKIFKDRPVNLSFISKKTAGIISPAKMLKIAYFWMLLITSINLIFCLFFPSIIFVNIGLIALYNIGMAAAMPLISIKALDCFPKARGTAASGQAFSQMLVSSVVAGLVIPIIWGSLATLAIGMLVIFSLGLITITKTQAWKDEELLLDE